MISAPSSRPNHPLQAPRPSAITLGQRAPFTDLGTTRSARRREEGGRWVGLLGTVLPPTPRPRPPPRSPPSGSQAPCAAGKEARSAGTHVALTRTGGRGQALCVEAGTPVRSRQLQKCPRAKEWPAVHLKLVTAAGPFLLLYPRRVGLRTGTERLQSRWERCSAWAPGLGTESARLSTRLRVGDCCGQTFPLRSSDLYLPQHIEMLLQNSRKDLTVIKRTTTEPW